MEQGYDAGGDGREGTGGVRGSSAVTVPDGTTTSAHAAPQLLPLQQSSFSSSFSDLNSIHHQHHSNHQIRQDSFRGGGGSDVDMINDSYDNDHIPSTPRPPPFFADAVLDLSEAHDIADTPEAPSHRTLLNASALSAAALPQQPSAAAMAGGSASDAGASVLIRAIPPAPFDGSDMIATDEDDGVVDVHLGDAVLPQDALTDDEPSRTPQEDDAFAVDVNSTPSQPSAPAAESASRPTLSTFGSLQSAHSSRVQPHRPKHPPRWPRDVPWAVAFVVLVPTVLIGAIVTAPSHPSPAHPTAGAQVMKQVAMAPSLRAVCWITLVISALASLAITHILYGRMSHNADRRHDAARIFTTYSPVVHVATCLALAVYVLYSTTHVAARVVGVVLPLYFCARDLFLFQRFVASSSSAYHRRRTSAMSDYDSPGGAYLGASGAASSSSSTSQQAFLQAMVETALDILSRSLNRGSRAPLGRAVAGFVVLQVLVLVLWRAALLACLQTDRLGLLLLVLVAGKWATGTCARFLTYLASGGVASWFDDQHQLLRQLPAGATRDGRSSVFNAASTVNAGTTMTNGYDDDDADPGRMPEAYRMVDASVYQSVLALDDIDDDDDLSVDAEYESDRQQPVPNASRAGGGVGRNGSNAAHRSAHSTSSRVTVKSLLSTGASVSFGSVAQCGLVGGVAQYVYGQVRKYNAARDFVAARLRQQQSLQQQQGSGRSSSRLGSNGFRSMAVESGGAEDRRTGRGRISPLRWGQRLGLSILHLARTFVRHYSDLAMCHVAAYYKSYRHSARDVATLVEESGVESILEDDITTHVCSCAGGAIAGIALTTASVIIGGTDAYDDWAVLANLLLSFYLSYTLLFTVFEPLRAAIKAFYVSFAQHPESLSQAFPLIYHRLSRLAAESSSMESSSLPMTREYARVSDLNASSSSNIQLV